MLSRNRELSLALEGITLSQFYDAKLQQTLKENTKNNYEQTQINMRLYIQAYVYTYVYSISVISDALSFVYNICSSIVNKFKLNKCNIRAGKMKWERKI